MRSAPREESTLAWLLAPTAVNDFWAQNFQRAPLHVRRNTAGFYDRYFSVAEFERVLYGTRLTTADLRLIKNGTEVRPELYVRASAQKYAAEYKAPARENIDADRASALFASGCTMNLNSVHLLSPPLAALTRDLESVFRARVVANIYLTPAKNQGFAAHYDCHDTLIVQVEGSKRWRVYHNPDLPLPLDHQLYNRTNIKPGELVFEVDLQPGDVLYLPRGFFHEGKANELLSLHVTFGLFPPRWVEVIADTLMQAAERDERLRRYAVPDDDTIPVLLANLFTTERLKSVLERMQREFAAQRSNDLEGQIREIAKIETLTPQSVVRKRSGLTYQLDEAPHGVVLRFSAKAVALPSAAGAIVAGLEHEGPVQISTLLEPKALDIVRKLIQEGFAVQCEPRARDSVA